MPTKPITQVRSAGRQSDNRWLATVYDQHKCPRFPNGRPFWGYLEYTTDKQKDPGFVTELLPGDHNDPNGSIWSAPWMPTQLSVGGNSPRSYFRLDTKQMRLTWNYRAIIADDTAALQQYYEAAAEIANVRGWPAVEYGQPVSFQIRAILRRPPRSPKIAEAALAGDLWILGLTDEVNEELAEIMVSTRPDMLLTGAAMLPEKVLEAKQAGTPDLEALIAKAIEAHEQKKADERAAKMRAGKKQKSAPATVAA